MQSSELDGYRIECPFTERLGIDPANTPTEGDNSMSSNLEALSYTQLGQKSRGSRWSSRERSSKRFSGDRGRALPEAGHNHGEGRGRQ